MKEDFYRDFPDLKRKSVPVFAADEKKSKEDKSKRGRRKKLLCISDGLCYNIPSGTEGSRRKEAALRLSLTGEKPSRLRFFRKG